MSDRYSDPEDDNSISYAQDRLEYASWQAIGRLIPGYGRPPRPVTVPTRGI